MKKLLMFTALVLAVFVFAGRAPAAPVVLDCTLYNSNSVVNINQPNDDIIINCPLIVKSVLIRAHSITVDHSGLNLGSITTTDKAGQKLLAGLNNNGDACGASPSPSSTETINIIQAKLEDQNSNGGITLRSCGNIEIDTNGGSSLQSVGANIDLTCFGTAAQIGSDCKIDVNTAFLHGNRILMDAQGDITLKCSTFETIGPRDLQKFVSEHGSVLAGGTSGVCNPADVAFICPSAGFELTFADVCLLCQCKPCKNKFTGGNESNMFVFGEEFVDLSNACITIAESITITADCSPTISGGVITGFAPFPFTGPGGPNTVALNLAGTEIRDDFGKTGFISIAACPGLINGHEYGPGDVPTKGLVGTGTINIDNAIVVDDGANGGGIDPQAVAYMNGDATSQACTTCCDGVVPDCGTGPIPNRGFDADPAARSLHHVVGTPRCDS